MLWVEVLQPTFAVLLAKARLDTSPSTDIGSSPARHEVPEEGLVAKMQLLAGTVGVNLAFFDHFQTIIVYAYGGIKT